MKAKVLVNFKFTSSSNFFLYMHVVRINKIKDYVTVKRKNR